MSAAWAVSVVRNTPPTIPDNIVVESNPDLAIWLHHPKRPRNFLQNSVFSVAPRPGRDCHPNNTSTVVFRAVRAGGAAGQKKLPGGTFASFLAEGPEPAAFAGAAGEGLVSPSH